MNTTETKSIQPPQAQENSSFIARASNIVNNYVVALLPLYAALLLEASIRFFSVQLGTSDSTASSPLRLLFILIQLSIESLPFFLWHNYLLRGANQNRVLPKRLVLWLLCFGGYPLVCLILVNNWEWYSTYTLFSVQGWLLMVAASVGILFNARQSVSALNKTTSLVSRLLSLNGAIVVSMFVWALIISGVFMNELDPMRNQPLPWLFDLGKILKDPLRYLSYFLQFSVVGFCALAIYFFNRNVLIRHLLSEKGIFIFVSGVLVTTIVLTPLLGASILAMPLNIPEQTLLPSEDHNLFAPINYQIVFWILVITTPVILAFERQHQSRAMAQITSERTRSELQLLQQQINPHFLFNTLNNLYALTLNRSENAPKMVLGLAELLRYTVYEGQNALVLLSKEINYLQNYLALQALRFGEGFTLKANFCEEGERWKLPPLLLIVIVENAFKHGVEATNGNSQIALDVTVEGNRLVLKCVNSLGADSPSRADSDGVGMANLQRRLQLLQPNTATFNSGKTESGEWLSELTLELTPC